ncbi:hypothetical protein M422DRAFT_275847 [Sphaerobolus stellatus SS14]|uniref:Uncharacterized protein n=1 Tax=Sphaerobolus stellatus (strain SS14) TaxID=990650 RepID=A0A0C9TNT5_SPHS4|nr:hypothetical protein M422DRAFT_275847 [Sphaerobolus stellatus SS14]
MDGDTDSPALLPVQSKRRRLENLRGKQPIGIAGQSTSTSASSALFSLPATMGTERLVVDLGSPLCHSMTSLPPLPPSHSKARYTPSSKPAAPRTTPAMPPPASRIHGRPSDTLASLSDFLHRLALLVDRGFSSIPSFRSDVHCHYDHLDIPTIKSVIFPVSKPTSIAPRTHVFAPLKNEHLFQSLSVSSSNYHCLDWWHNRNVAVYLSAAPAESTVSTPSSSQASTTSITYGLHCTPAQHWPTAAASISGQHYGARGPSNPILSTLLPRSQ